ncbi:thioesterase II family protein [Streptomyces sp. NPDC048604]|uniref:thioesterase II family protein n=1 Tax=Streptomyces sp. NPDC048604 TaxID=3365578 RepID=UPI0037121300
MTHPGEREADRWLRCFHPRVSAEHTLVCFPHAGGAASYYHGISAALAPDVETLVVQYPGREKRLFEEPAPSVEWLADAVARALVARGVQRPVLFGHSRGAIVAFETARRLHRTAGQPAALVASACAAPSHPEARRALGDGLAGQSDTEVLTRLLGLGGTDADVAQHAELIELVLPALRADLAALTRYRAAPDATVPCPVSVYAADDDPDVPAADAALWGRHAAGGTVEVHRFEGGHFYFGSLPRPFLDRLQQTVRTARKGIAFA